MAMIVASACHRSPVAMSRASMSERVARNSHMSAYILQSLLPYFLSTRFLTCSRRTFRTSQMATNWTSFSGSIQPRSHSPRAPVPMAPSTIRSLGATAPPRPSADAGTMVGASTAAPAAAAVCRHSLRVIRVVDVVFLVDLVPLIASPPLRIPEESHNDLLAKAPLGDHGLAIPSGLSLLQPRVSNDPPRQLVRTRTSWSYWIIHHGLEQKAQERNSQTSWSSLLMPGVILPSPPS